eukprot:Hpha_TRINITY_DN14991_c1_g3::TRINITY_DN14991_c1_g3_i1::g.142889::m.142889
METVRRVVGQIASSSGMLSADSVYMAGSTAVVIGGLAGLAAGSGFGAIAVVIGLVMLAEHTGLKFGILDAAANLLTSTVQEVTKRIPIPAGMHGDRLIMGAVAAVLGQTTGGLMIAMSGLLAGPSSASAAPLLPVHAGRAPGSVGHRGW